MPRVYAGDAGDILARFDSAVRRLKDATLRGLISAQAKIHRDMLTVRPTIPRDTGNLRKSYYCVTSNGAIVTGRSPSFAEKKAGDADKLGGQHDAIVGAALNDAISRGKTDGPNIIIGFSAYYSFFIHNDINKVRNWSLPGSGPWFFSTALRRNSKEILKIIAKHART